VSAVEEYNSHYVHFTSIIAQLSGAQARLFSELFASREGLSQIESSYPLGMPYIEHCIEKAFKHYFSKDIYEYVTDIVKEELDNSGYVCASILYKGASTHQKATYNSKPHIARRRVKNGTKAPVSRVPA
jgi:hypothetical protein